MSKNGRTHAELLVELEALRTRLERLQREAADRQETEARWQRLREQLPCTFWSTDAQLRITFSAGAGLFALGLKPGEVVGLTLHDLYQNDAVGPVHIDVHRRALQGESIRWWEVEWRGRTSQAHLEPLRDSGGCIIGVIGLALDVTERKLAERELAENRRRFQAVFENALDGMTLMDDAGRYVDGNPTVCQSLGYSRDEFRQMSIWDFTPVPQHARIRQLLDELLTAGTASGEYTASSKVGAPRVFEYRSTANILPGLHLSVHRDVTERKQVEEKLQQSERRLAEAQRIAHIGSWERDLRTDAITWSDELYRLFGLRPGEFDVSFESFLQLVCREDVEGLRTEVDRAVRERRPYGCDYRIVLPDGALRLIHSRGEVVLDAEGEPVRLVGTTQDVTERRRAELALHEHTARIQGLSRRLVRVQEDERRHLARELHDEVGQTLTGLHLLLEEVAGPAAAVQPRLAEARELLRALLDKLRQMSFDLRPAQLDHLGLLAALLTLFERYTNVTGIQVHFKHAGMEERFPPEVETTCYRVVQEALTNIARHAGVREAVVRLWTEAGKVVVQIEDRGAGFDPEAVLKGRETIGLPGIYERVSLLGGQLSIESAPETGTWLTAELPAG